MFQSQSGNKDLGIFQSLGEALKLREYINQKGVKKLVKFATIKMHLGSAIKPVWIPTEFC